MLMDKTNFKHSDFVEISTLKMQPLRSNCERQQCALSLMADALLLTCPSLILCSDSFADKFQRQSFLISTLKTSENLANGRLFLSVKHVRGASQKGLVMFSLRRGEIKLKLLERNDSS